MASSSSRRWPEPAGLDGGSPESRVGLVPSVFAWCGLSLPTDGADVVRREDEFEEGFEHPQCVKLFLQSVAVSGGGDAFYTFRAFYSAAYMFGDLSDMITKMKLSRLFSQPQIFILWWRTVRL